MSTGFDASYAARNTPEARQELESIRAGVKAERHDVLLEELSRHRDHLLPGSVEEIARQHERLDVIDREQAMRDHVRALMPGRTLGDLASARARVRAHCKAAGIVIGA